MRYILALDQGTSSSKSLLIDSKGSILAKSKERLNSIYPQNGWVELDPEQIWETQLASVQKTIQQASIKPSDIATIGISNQRETTIIWDRKTSKPVCNAICWMDRRSVSICDSLKAANKESIFKQKTGLILDPYFSGTKIAYILKANPKLYLRAVNGELAFGTVDSWLCWKLTKGALHITDATNASRTLLYNIHTHQWDDELLQILDIPKALLPEVKNSSEIYGFTHPDILGEQILISGIAGDQQASLFGQTCFHAGQAKATYGTGCFILLNTGCVAVPSNHHLLTTIAIQLHNQTTYALEGSVFNCGTTLQWLIENLKVYPSIEDLDKAAENAKNNGDVYFVPAFTGLGAPHWDPYARGSIFGLTRNCMNYHLARAALESIAFQATDILHAMINDYKHPIDEIRVDGGCIASSFLLQFQSDLQRTRILKPENSELSAIGAAFLAGLSIGYWKNLQEIESLWKLQKTFLPQMDINIRNSLMQKWSKAVCHAKHWEGPI